jgi:hypothetical protein
MQSSEIVTGLPKFKVDGMHKICEACQFGKQTKNVSKRALDVVHLDVWGPTKTASMGGCRYYVSFIDDHTRRVWVYFMKEKNEVFTHFQNFRMLAEKQTGLQASQLVGLDNYTYGMVDPKPIGKNKRVNMWGWTNRKPLQKIVVGLDMPLL